MSTEPEPILAVQYRVSTREVLKHFDLSKVVSDVTQPIPGQTDPDVKVLIKVTPYQPPMYDERYYELQAVPAVVMTAPAGFHESYGQWVTTYTTVQRSLEEIDQAIDNAKRQAMQQICPSEKQLEVFFTMCGSLDRKANAMALTDAERAVLETGACYHAKFMQNEAIAKAKKTAVRAGSKPDIDADFIRS